MGGESEDHFTVAPIGLGPRTRGGGVVALLIPRVVLGFSRSCPVRILRAPTSTTLPADCRGGLRRAHGLLSVRINVRASPCKTRSCMMSADIMPVSHVSGSFWYDLFIFDTIMRGYLDG